MAMDQQIDAQVTGHLHRHVRQTRTAHLREHPIARGHLTEQEHQTGRDHPIERQHPTEAEMELQCPTDNQHPTDLQTFLLQTGRAHRMEGEVAQWAEEVVHLEAAVEEGDNGSEMNLVKSQS